MSSVCPGPEVEPIFYLEECFPLMGFHRALIAIFRGLQAYYNTRFIPWISQMRAQFGKVINFYLFISCCILVVFEILGVGRSV